MQQKRLLIALLLSAGILFLWTYVFPPTTPEKPAEPPSPAATPAAQQAANQTTTPAPAPAPVQSVNAAPQRTITIKTPLYDAKFDTLGAEPISWILKKNKNSGAEIWSVAGHKKDRIPLELTLGGLGWRATPMTPTGGAVHRRGTSPTAEG